MYVLVRKDYLSCGTARNGLRFVQFLLDGASHPQSRSPLSF